MLMSGFAFEDHLSYSVVRFEPTLHDMSWGDVESEAASVSEKLRDATTGNLLIDLSPMELIQSGLVASMVRMWKATEDHPKRPVVVAAPNEIVNEVLRSAGLFKVFNVVDSLEEATSKFGASKLGQSVSGQKSVPAWGLALVMLLVGLVVGAGGIMFFGSGSSDQTDTPDQPNSNNDGDAAGSESPPSKTPSEDEPAEPDDSASSQLDGEGRLTVRGVRKASKVKEDTDDEAGKNESVKEASEAPPVSDPDSGDT